MSKARMAELRDLESGIETFEKHLVEATTEFDKQRFRNTIASMHKRRETISQAVFDERNAKLVKAVQKISGLGLDDWWEQMKKLYTITPLFKVISNARDWNEEKSWQCSSKIECQEKVLQLLEYKQTDRARGLGSVEQDFQRIEEITNPNHTVKE